MRTYTRTYAIQLEVEVEDTFLEHAVVEEDRPFVNEQDVVDMYVHQNHLQGYEYSPKDIRVRMIGSFTLSR